MGTWSQDAIDSSWVALWNAVGQTAPADALGTLLEHYAERHRQYHTINHVGSCLEELRLCTVPSSDRNALALAFWYHDIVYDPKAADNEEASAELAVAVLQEAGAADELIELVDRLIRATDHRVEVEGPLEELMVDIDLAVLGAPEQEYEAYQNAIRFEYSWVQERDYAKGRSAVLDQFLLREQIYRTAPFASREDQARENMLRERAAWMAVLG